MLGTCCCASVRINDWRFFFKLDMFYLRKAAHCYVAVARTVKWGQFNIVGQFNKYFTNLLTS